MTICHKCYEPLQARYTGIQHEYKNPIPFTDLVSDANFRNGCVNKGWLVCLNPKCKDGKHNSSIISEPIPF